jgi:uncharacterized protein (DUF885 family)
VAAPQPSINEVIAGLEGLPFDQFIDESSLQHLLRYPEAVTELGLADTLGLRNDKLNDLSDGYVRETQQLEVAILELLRGYDLSALTPEQQITYDVYEWYLDDLVRGHEFMYYDYPVHHFIRSYHLNIDALFTEIHPLEDRADVEDYLARLSQVDEQVAQLIESLRLREDAEVVPPDFIIELAIADIKSYLSWSGIDSSRISAELLPVYIVFEEKLGGIEGLQADEREAFLAVALVEIQESFVPAFVELVEYLAYLETVASNKSGLWQFPEGEAYYAYMLRKETSTDLTPQEVHEIGLAEVERIQAEMRAVFDDLGYPEDEDLGSLMERAVEEGGYYNISSQAGKDEYIQAIETIIAEIAQKVGEVFDLQPSGELVVTPGPIGGFYTPGTPDGTRPGAYHVSIAGTWKAKFNMQTIAYHEAIPGHHFQIAIAQELDLPEFRNSLSFNAYAEGWALYAEYLAWELGMYEDNPYGNLGRLQTELLRAVRLVTDTGIHAMRWTRAEAKAYMREALGDPEGRWAHEVERYIVLPAQATGYKIGMLKILELRQLAMDELGDQFDIKEFHHVVLGNGSVPLSVLERLVLDYIEAKKGS